MSVLNYRAGMLNRRLNSLSAPHQCDSGIPLLLYAEKHWISRLHTVERNKSVNVLSPILLDEYSVVCSAFCSSELS